MNAKTLCIVGSLALLVSPTVGIAQPYDMGTAFTYQGRLDFGGVLVTDTCDFAFSLWDDSTGGLQQGTTQMEPNVSVEGGLFTVSIDFGAGAMNGEARWLEIAACCPSSCSPVALSPRQELTPSPYALRASNGVGGPNALHVLTTGEVGIGTEIPGEKREVDGVIHAASGGVRFPDGTLQTTAATPGGSVFTRWGNSNPPAGTSLVYWGYGYATLYNYGASNIPIVVAPNDPGQPRSGSAINMLSALTTGSTGLPSGINPNSYIKAAVCYVDAPTVEVWGTWTAPSGWEVIYQGYALGGNYTYQGPTGPICVDSFDFEYQGGSTPSTVWAADIEYYAPPDGALLGRYVKCAVCKKN